jgi:hypothetical protein
LEPRAEQAQELECEINNLKHQIKRLKCDNNLLADTNELQARLIKSRPSSPCPPPCPPPSTTVHSVVRCSRPASPVNCSSTTVVTTCTTPRLTRSASTYNCSTVCVEAKPSSLSPLSPNNCTQVIRQESLINRFNNLYCRDRQHAVSTLKCYLADCEIINRIVFAAVQACFLVFYL